MTQVNGRRLAAMMAGALVMGVASSANATRVFFTDFSGLNGGVSASNYTGIPGLTVAAGAVDLVHDGDNGIQCPVSFGSLDNSCIDLEGANGTYGRLRSAAYEVHAGDTVTLSFSASANQWTVEDEFPFDLFSATFLWGPAIVDLDQLNIGPMLPSLNPGPSTGAGYVFQPHYPQEYLLSFVAPQDMMVSFRLAGANPADVPADDMGVLIGDIALDITPATAAPEPATWAMMLLGFGALGAVLRRRRAAWG